MENDKIDPVSVLSGKLYEINKYFETQIRIRVSKCDELEKENSSLKKELKSMKFEREDLIDNLNKLEEKILELNLKLSNKNLKPIEVKQEKKKLKSKEVEQEDKVRHGECDKTKSLKNSKNVKEEILKVESQKGRKRTLPHEPEASKPDPTNKRVMKMPQEAPNVNIYHRDQSKKENKRVKLTEDTLRDSPVPIKLLPIKKELQKSGLEAEDTSVLPSNVFSMILKYIPLGDLRKCRQVSPNWNSLAINELKRRGPRHLEEWSNTNRTFFPFITINSDKMESFLNVFKPQDKNLFPYQYFKLYPAKISLQSLTMFFNQFGDHILNLYMRSCSDSSLNLLKLCPKIEKLWVDGVNVSACSEILNLKHLRELALMESNGNGIIPHTIINKFCSMSLQVFTLYLDDVNKNILSLPFDLSKITLGFKEASFWNQISRFLESQYNLSELKLVMGNPDEETSDSEHVIQFPILKNLETLEIKILKNSPKLKPAILQLPKLTNLIIKLYDKNNLDFFLGSNFSTVSNLKLKLNESVDIKWNTIFSTTNLKSVIFNTTGQKMVKDLIAANFRLEKFHLSYNIPEHLFTSETNCLISLLTGYMPALWSVLVRHKYNYEDFAKKEDFLSKTQNDRSNQGSLFQLQGLKDLTVEIIRNKLIPTFLEQGVIEHSLCILNRLRRLELRNVKINHVSLNLLKERHDVVRVTPSLNSYYEML